MDRIGKRKRKGGQSVIRVLFKAAGLMVPEPSTRSPPIAFIGAGPGWEEPYIAGQGRGRGGLKAVARPMARQGRDKAKNGRAGGRTEG